MEATSFALMVYSFHESSVVYFLTVLFLTFALLESLALCCSHLSFLVFPALKIIGNSSSHGGVEHPEHSGRRLAHIGAARQQRPIPSIGQ